MIICPKCGVQNPLGRVFCDGCGAKLDIANLTSEDVRAMHRTHWLSRHWRKLAGLAAALVLALVGLAFWPQTRPVGERGGKPHGVRLRERLKAIDMLGRGQTLGVTVPEADLNGLIEFFMAGSLGVDSISVDVSPGSVHVRVIRNLFGFTVAGHRVEPKLSYDLYCIPVGRVLAVRQVRMGHLGAGGPLRTSILRKIYAMAVQQPEWKLATAHLSQIEANQDELVLTVKK